MMRTSSRVEIGRTAQKWSLIFALFFVTYLLQVELGRGDAVPQGYCDPGKTCPDPSMCCSISNYCGTNSSYCGLGSCAGGPCWNTPTGNATNGKKGLSVGVAVGIAIGAVAGLGVFFLGIMLFVRRRVQENAKRNRFLAQDLESKVLESAYNRQVSVASTLSGISKNLSMQSSDLGRRLSYETLHWATGGFSVELGRGSFGVVYKGTLLDGTDIAVKKLLDGERDMKDFEAEIKTLGRINHANLVALLGFTFENNKLFLVYEFVANGSLDRWIFEDVKENPDFVLPWKTRVDILKGTAKGLAYLHEELQRGQTIVHLDIKPQNILLDQFYAPKIADFGLAKLLGSATTKQTLAGGGTKGYMAPEIYVAAVSQKMDVYSFGMVMLEVVSGREHEDPDLPPDSLFLPSWALRKVLEGDEDDVVDPLLEEDQFDANEADRLIWIALLCLQGDPFERPGISSVLKMMEGIIDPPNLPPSLKGELEKAEKLIRGRLAGDSSLDSSDNMIKFSGESRKGSRKYKGRRRRTSQRSRDSNEKPLIGRRVPNTSGF
ncbi:unnamed protein product [Calypogeia fissa]